LLALWGVVSLLLPGNWRPSFLIALWFSVSPYVAAWSNWPAYAVFFPCLALISAIAILRSHNKYLLLALGCILGVDLAGFVLFLYPPWQVSLTYVFLALAVGIIVRDKLYRNFSKIRLASFGIAIIISSLILWKWWSDAHVAIQAMMATVYPGQRTEVAGGSMSLTYLLRGFTNIITLNKSDIANTNQCEIASFPYILLPLVLIFVFRAYQRAIGAIEIALALSICVILYFMLAGIPIDVAKFSLWGRVPPNRADLALGLSNIILCGILLVSDKKPIPDKMTLKILVVVIALLWAAIGNNSISRLDESSHFGLSPVVSVGLFFVTAIAGYWLASGKFREFIYLSLAWSVATTWPFNPIRIAPDSINASFYVNDLRKRSGSDSSRPILVLESNAAAVFLSAFGLPAINGVFYYPQKSLWEQLDKNRTEWNTYNRYQHLYFSGGVVENADHYQIKSTHVDVVRVVVDFERFDFRKTGARLIVGPQHEENALRKNASLIYIKNENGWSWFQIRGGLNVN
jgi:hypothetical protein